MRRREPKEKTGRPWAARMIWAAAEAIPEAWQKNPRIAVSNRQKSRYFPEILMTGSWGKKIVPSGIASTVMGRLSRSVITSGNPQNTAQVSGSADAVTSIQTSGLIASLLSVSSCLLYTSDAADE